MMITKLPRFAKIEVETACVKSKALLPSDLIDHLSSARKPYIAPMLIALGTSQIGTGATSSLAEANFGLFGSAS